MPVTHPTPGRIYDAAWEGAMFVTSIAEDTLQEDDLEIARAAKWANIRVRQVSTEESWELLAMIAACCAVMSFGWRDVEQETRDMARLAIRQSTEA